MARKKANIHYIYKTTCNVTGKWYVGMHSTTKLDDSYMGSGTILRHSIRKYGVENHTKEILEFLETREELVIREIEIVTKELISNGKCMNLKEGGNGGFVSFEAVKKGRAMTDKILLEKYGVDFRKIVTKNYRDSLSDNDKEILKNKLKEGQKAVNFNHNTFEGKEHTKATKQRMSEAKKGKYRGETNSQYGTCWITNEIENKKIYKGNEIPNGWRLGRKMK